VNGGPTDKPDWTGPPGWGGGSGPESDIYSTRRVGPPDRLWTIRQRGRGSTGLVATDHEMERHTRNATKPSMSAQSGNQITFANPPALHYLRWTPHQRKLRLEVISDEQKLDLPVHPHIARHPWRPGALHRPGPRWPASRPRFRPLSSSTPAASYLWSQSRQVH
jgi:hypothetical protein